MRLWIHRFNFFSLAASLLLLTPSAHAANMPLGTASGPDASLTTDGTHWTALESGSQPLYAPASLRAGKQSASAFLRDQTQLELRPGTTITLTGTRQAPIVTIKGGRLFFRTSARSTVRFITPTATYRAAGHDPRHTGELITAKATTVSDSDPIGAITVDRAGHAILALQSGEMLSAPLDNGAADQLAQTPVMPPDISRELGYPDPGSPGIITSDANDLVIPTAIGIGVAGAGAGIAIGLNNHHSASPSKP